MFKIVDECCECATENYPCLGNSCPRRNVKRYYCDKCREESILYHYEGEELCISCIIKSLDVVEGSI